MTLSRGRCSVVYGQGGRSSVGAEGQLDDRLSTQRHFDAFCAVFCQNAALAALARHEPHQEDQVAAGGAARQGREGLKPYQALREVVDVNVVPAFGFSWPGCEMIFVSRE